ncbi:MAG: hypothetical protein AUK47_04970 [Deltaproteobacteria bacterium CG2_30_63_29]|nr:MAG: hypothetical protein AUK47_04970 [Deltaproteobacteria bacterium CG2_30_63_29]PJB47358.1 MAG: hypothetical protein CO108_04260 [Deltaproteobacteria bacterium CG_4_9_14_3_um_filter_63_12]
MQQLTRIFICLLFLAVPNLATAQSDDPCFEYLSSDSAALQQYETLVDRFLDADETLQKLELLDALWATCDVNLRLVVLRGDALREHGDCAEASREYLFVIDRADAWPIPDNGKDAKQKAEAGLTLLESSCLANVQISCATTQAQVTLGDRSPQACPTTMVVAEGQYSVSVSARGFNTLTRTYTFRTGNNFVEVEALTAMERAGEVEFVCDEREVEVMIGSERFGCPALRSFEAGTVHFAAQRPNGEPFEGTVEVVEGKRVTAVIPSSGANAGVLKVECQPAAMVEVSGPAIPKLIRQSCPTSLPLPKGQYQATITGQDGERQTRTVSVRSGETVSLKVATASNVDAPRLLIAALGGYGVISDEKADAAALSVTLSVPYAEYVEVALLFRESWIMEDSEFTTLGAFLFRYIITTPTLRIGLGGGMGYGEAVAIQKDNGSLLTYLVDALVSVKLAGPVDFIIGADVFFQSVSTDEPVTVFDILGGIELRF